MSANELRCFLILLITLLHYRCFENVELEENDACATQHYHGICMRNSKCPHIREFMEALGLKSTDVEHCGYVVHEETICCPQKASLVRSSDRPAVQACEKLESRLITHGIIYDSKIQRRYPHMANIVYNISGHFCGGTLIEKNYVLTAAHCLQIPAAKAVQVILGAIDLKRFEEGHDGIGVEIKTIYIHENYSSFTKYDDIGLIELAKDVVYDANINPACLHTDSSELFNGTELIVTGWGRTEKHYRSTQLMMAKLMYIPLAQCNESYARYKDRRIPSGILDTQVCAFAPGRDICGGDSGGGLVTIDNDKYKVVGIVSANINCGANLPSIHTRVAKYLDFIEGIIWPND